MTSNCGHIIELLGNVDDWEAYIKQLASNFCGEMTLPLLLISKRFCLVPVGMPHT